MNSQERALPKKAESSAVALFAKYPAAGLAKTRMIPMLGPEGAARLARYLLLSMLERFLQQAPAELEVSVWTAGGKASDWQTLLLPLDASIRERIIWAEQAQTHLGRRMECALQTLLKRSARAVIVGTDAVEFGKTSLACMYHALEESSMAFTPALDGGYVAIGATIVNSALLGESIQWGTSKVMMQTQQIAAEMSQPIVCLPPQLDLDEPEDLELAISQGLIPVDWAEYYRG